VGNDRTEDCVTGDAAVSIFTEIVVIIKRPVMKGNFITCSKLTGTFT
jgi:hypothetical protein